MREVRGPVRTGLGDRDQERVRRRAERGVDLGRALGQTTADPPQQPTDLLLQTADGLVASYVVHDVVLDPSRAGEVVDYALHQPDTRREILGRTVPGYGRLPVLKTGWGTSPVPLQQGA